MAIDTENKRRSVMEEELYPVPNAQVDYEDKLVAIGEYIGLSVRPDPGQDPDLVGTTRTVKRAPPHSIRRNMSVLY